MVLHGIAEEDSDDEDENDDGNKTFDAGHSSNALPIINEEFNKGINNNNSPQGALAELSPIKQMKTNKFSSLDLSKLDNKRLKQFIHNQSRYEKDLEEKRKMKETKIKSLVSPLNLAVLGNNPEGTIHTPRFDEEEDKHDEPKKEVEADKINLINNRGPVPDLSDLKTLNEKIRLLKDQSSDIEGAMGLDESGILEYSMVMQRQFRGLLNDVNESSVMNDTLNTSNLGGHRRQYSTDESVLFGRNFVDDSFSKGPVDDSFTKGPVDAEDKTNINSTNFLNLNGLFTDNDKQSNSFDINLQEQEFKKMFEDNEANEVEPRQKSEENGTRNIFGLRNDTYSGSEDHSNERPKTPESDNGAFNPFKSPVVPEAIISPSKSESNRERSKSRDLSEENKSETGEIKFVHDQISEWNKRITSAINEENYYNDSKTKPMKRAPSNPLEKLTLENMKNVNGPAVKNDKKKYLRPSVVQEESEKNMKVAGSENKKAHNLDPKTHFVSFNVGGDEVPVLENEDYVKEILKIEIILIIVHTDIVSDFEVNRSKKYLKDFLAQNEE
jgi:hypothetical protein